MIENVFTDNELIFSDKECQMVVISTRHNSHANLVLKAIDNNKHIFVEKPLCLTQDELNAIKERLLDKDRHLQLTVGFNRRFSVLAQQLKTLAQSTGEPMAISYTINAGKIAMDHWTQDPHVGGGRLLGEVCHFVDLCRFIAGSAIVSHRIVSLKSAGSTTDSWQILIEFTNGSIATINYFTNGNKALPKEHILVNTGGKSLQLDNFLSIKANGFGRSKNIRLWRQDKGQIQCAASVIDHLKNGKPGPIPIEEIVETAQACIDLWDSVK